MNRKNNIWVFTLLIFVCGCSKSEQCRFASPNFLFIGYSGDERDTLILRTYKQGSGFEVLNDSLKIDPASWQEHLTATYGTDSFTAHFYYHTDDFYKYDWELELPGPNRVYQIQDITVSWLEKLKSSNDICYSYIKQCKINGSLISSYGFSTSLIIRK